ncbi:hypothetical protein [Sphingomonas morindae]|uniref:Uncharacterized protein n=1 Tax=Sphingomonas morindae TaxID=1541170 RepID=A0ABY4X6D3_9SPHN|nr:hypothetical protein [Sphingomonas morindae]USI72473.1 hypothetical protein LHA26_14425 [Sphingomonas morindae]
MTLVNSLVALLLLLALFPAGRALRDELLVRDARRGLALAQQGAAPPRPAAGELPARAALLWSAVLTGEAARQRDPALRDPELRAAARLIDRADAQRGLWGNADIGRAYLLSVAQGPASPAALAALAQSYRHAGFLHDAAAWRIPYGLQVWPQLDGATRRHLIEEAAWFSTLPKGYGDTMAALVGQPAEVPVFRLRAALDRMFGTHVSHTPGG